MAEVVIKTAKVSSAMSASLGREVLDLLKAMEGVLGCPLPHTFGDRRPGDIACYYASAEQAQVRLHWRARRTLADMCRDAWCWQTQNPEGYP